MTYTGSDDLTVSLDDGVLSVTLNRPDTLNSLSLAMLELVGDAVLQAATDPAVKVVRLGGDVSPYVPANVAVALAEKFPRGDV